MKKFILLLALVSATASSDLGAADGTVNLSNYESNNPIFYTPGPTCSLLPVEGSFVQVLGGPVGGALQVLASTGPGNPTIFPLAKPGFFDGGFAVVPGVGESAQGSFQVRAWRNGATFEAATLTYKASSAVFQSAVGLNPPLPGIPMPRPLPMPSFGCIPEPSTTLLSLIAAMALAVRRVCFAPHLWS